VCRYVGVHHKGGCSFGHDLIRYAEVREGSVMEVGRSEAVEAELNRLIEKRFTQQMDPDEREESWQASVRAYNERRRREIRAAWAAFHQDQAERHRRTLDNLIAHHEGEAARLCGDSEARGEGLS
jgi:hypothetical protein